MSKTDKDIIKVEVEDEELKGLFRRLSSRMSDMSPVMRVISGIMHNAVEENFEKEGRPQWQDLEEFTKKRRKRKGYWPGKILQMREELATSVVPGYNSHSAWASTNKKYAAIHHFGGDVNHKARERTVFFKQYKRGERAGKTLFAKESKASFGRKVMGGSYTISMPARPFMTLTDGDKDEMHKAVLSYITDGNL